MPARSATIGDLGVGEAVASEHVRGGLEDVHALGALVDTARHLLADFLK